MNHRLLYKRITNLDRYYSGWDVFGTEAMKLRSYSEERRWLLRLIARRYRKLYDRMVGDRRRTDA